MKPILKHAIWLLVLNGFVTLCFFAAMMSLFRDDPFMVAIPLAMAFPVILIQPWYLLFLIIPLGFFIAPFGATLASILIHQKLSRSQTKPAGFFSLWRSKKAVMIYGLFILLGIGLFYLRYIDFPVLHQGTPKRLEVELGDSAKSIRNGRYYHLPQMIDSEYVFRADLSPEAFQSMMETLGLERSETKEPPKNFLNKPPYWWKLRGGQSGALYQTKNFPLSGRGADGWYVMAHYDSQSQVLRLWVKDNF